MTREFPEAIPQDQFVARSYEGLSQTQDFGGEYDRVRERLLPRDEATLSWSEILKKPWGEVFIFSSLGGMLALGKTGFLAAQQHAPTEDDESDMPITPCRTLRSAPGRISAFISSWSPEGFPCLWCLDGLFNVNLRAGRFSWRSILMTWSKVCSSNICWQAPVRRYSGFTVFDQDRSRGHPRRTRTDDSS